jgi:anaerobic selenocysteine-containing dehydrogenase
VRERGDWDRHFPTPSGRFEFFSSALEKKLREIGSAAGEADDKDALRRGCERLGLVASGDEACLPHYEPPREAGEGDVALLPFRPITARGRLGVTSPMVMEMFGYAVLSGWETWIELIPETASELDVADGDLVAVQTARGAIEAVARVRPGATPGAAHVALGLGQRAPTTASTTVGSNPMEVLESAVDRLSGGLSTASSRARLRLVRRRRHGGPAPLLEEEA